MVLRAVFFSCQKMHRGQEGSKQGISGCCVSMSFRPWLDLNSPGASSWGFCKAEAAHCSHFTAKMSGCSAAAFFAPVPSGNKKKNQGFHSHLWRLRGSFWEAQGRCSMAGSGMPAVGTSSAGPAPTLAQARIIVRGESFPCVSPGPGRAKAAVLHRAERPQHKIAGWSAFLKKPPKPQQSIYFKHTNRILGTQLAL